MLDFNNIEKRIREMKKDSKEENMLSRSDKYLPVLEIVRRFLVKNELIFYGGMAQNLYLPPKDRFYTSTDLPDFDVFSSTPEKHAKELVDLLISKGYSFVTVRYALHEGTYKVSWDFEDIADITQVTPNDMKRLRSEARLYRKAPLCPIEVLKANAYIELAMPQSSMFRWTKVLDRLIRIEKAHPVEQKVVAEYTSVPDSMRACVNTVATVCEGLPYAGTHAIRYYTGLPYDLSKCLMNTPFLEMICTTPKTTMDKVVQHVTSTKPKLQLKRYTMHTDTMLMNPIECLMIRFNSRQGWTPLLHLHDTSSKCIGIQRDNETKTLFMSIFMVIRNIYMERFFRTGSFPEISLLIDNIKLEDLTSECYGHSRSVLSVKKSRARKNMSSVFYNPRIK
jgi:hypothetical protein